MSKTKNVIIKKGMGMILHIMILDKFLPPFIDFISKHFDITKHKFVFLGRKEYKYGLKPSHPIEWIDSKNKVFKLLYYMYISEKIVIHGLWSRHLVKLLFFQPWLLKKCYWVMWGGDFYFPEKQDWIKKQVIRRIGHFVTYIRGDYELVKKWYGSTGKYHECLMYPSNVFFDYGVKTKQDTTINIQVGNSATDTNNHFEAFNKLAKFKDENIRIYCPLSYGDKKYAEEVILYGKKLFGEKFIPITEFMPLEKYLDFLGSMDIAIFPHNRQQAMGNIIKLLGMGKKVYLRKNTTHRELFEVLGIKIYDLDEISLEPMDEQVRSNNISKVKQYFSEEKLREQLDAIFRK